MISFGSWALDFGFFLSPTPYPVPRIPGVLGRELLRHLLPKEDYIEIAKKYQKVKKWVKEK
jgi:hypothetical protein